MTYLAVSPGISVRQGLRCRRTAYDLDWPGDAWLVLRCAGEVAGERAPLLSRYERGTPVVTAVAPGWMAPMVWSRLITTVCRSFLGREEETQLRDMDRIETIASIERKLPPSTQYLLFASTSASPQPALPQVPYAGRKERRGDGGGDGEQLHLPGLPKGGRVVEELVGGVASRPLLVRHGDVEVRADLLPAEAVLEAADLELLGRDETLDLVDAARAALVLPSWRGGGRTYYEV